MKRFTLLICLLGSFHSSFSQTNTFPATGNVGIGTLTPGTKLSVNSGLAATSTIDLANSITVGTGNANATSKYLGQFGFVSNDVDFSAPKMVAYISGESAETYSDNTKTASVMRFFTGSVGGTSPAERMVIDQTGNVGIGTSAPNTLVYLKSANPTMLTMERTGSTTNVNMIYKNTSNTIYTGLDGDGGFTVSKAANLLTESILTVQTGGNVGIGTSTPSDKLSVNGMIRAKEIKVEVTGWPDFVFAKDYKLPSLVETEKHIREKGHLPGIPSTADVIKSGVELGEMNKKLLQKIEELTLHLIEQNKSIKELQDEIKDLKK